MSSGFDNSLRCKICGGRLIRDLERGEAFCSVCGSVLDERLVDLGPEWKAIDSEEKEKKVRVGSPITPRFHDYGLGSEIEHAQDHNQKNESLRVWQKRLRTSTPAERNLVQALSKINDLCESLKMPLFVAETASRIYRQLLKKGVAKSKCMAKMTAAIVYFSAKLHGVERSVREISEAAGVDVKTVNKYYRLIAAEVQVEHLPLPSIEKQIARLANLMKVSAKTERLALQLYKATKAASIQDGKSPSGLAAAYLYIASVINGENIPQREVAAIAEITDVTVRHRYREILENFVIKQTLKPLKGTTA
jgi:transcription initiation factor TFIIB